MMKDQKQGEVMQTTPPHNAQPQQPQPVCKIEMPNRDDYALFKGTKLVHDAYTFDVDKQIGEGTYGQVFIGHCKASGNKVALKKIKLDMEKDGFPITAIREIKILTRMKNDNIVNMREIVRSEIHKNNQFRGSVYMVFDYCEFDLTGLQGYVKNKFTAAQVKCILLQLLKGLLYLASQGVLHRDLKAANILINAQGQVKLADFGLARTFTTSNESRLTNRVITLWYRPPELLLGVDKYGPEVDMWSIGCIFAELLVGKPLFPGKDEMDQMSQITSIMGMPPKEVVSKIPQYNQVAVPKSGPKSLLKTWLAETAKKNGNENNIQDPACIDLLEKFLHYDPKLRIDAKGALQHEYFRNEPHPSDPQDLPVRHGSGHEMSVKRKREEERVVQESRQHPHAHPHPHGGYVHHPGQGQGHPRPQMPAPHPSQGQQQRNPPHAPNNQPRPPSSQAQGQGKTGTGPPIGRGAGSHLGPPPGVQTHNMLSKMGLVGQGAGGGSTSGPRPPSTGPHPSLDPSHRPRGIPPGPGGFGPPAPGGSGQGQRGPPSVSHNASLAQRGPGQPGGPRGPVNPHPPPSHLQQQQPKR